jgi:hypothetical protein
MAKRKSGRAHSRAAAIQDEARRVYSVLVRKLQEAIQASLDLGFRFCDHEKVLDAARALKYALADPRLQNCDLVHKLLEDFETEYHGAATQDLDEAMKKIVARCKAVLTDLKTPHPRGSRARSARQNVVLRTQAAIAHKLKSPGASMTACAKAAKIPRKTLGDQSEWREWSQKIEDAVRSRRLGSVRSQFDKRIGRVAATASSP